MVVDHSSSSSLAMIFRGNPDLAHTSSALEQVSCEGFIGQAYLQCSIGIVVEQLLGTPGKNMGFDEKHNMDYVNGVAIEMESMVCLWV